MHFPQVEWKRRAKRTSLHPVLVLEDHSMIPIMSLGFSPEPSIRSSNNRMHHEGWNHEQPPYVKGEMLFLLGARPREAIPVPMTCDDRIRGNSLICTPIGSPFSYVWHAIYASQATFYRLDLSAIRLTSSATDRVASRCLFKKDSVRVIRLALPSLGFE
jgi:hypothetical protein